MGVDTNCRSYRLAIEILGRPWTAQILNLLVQEGPLRFSEIGERIAGIGDKVLSARLKELEARGLCVRSVAPGPPVRVGYALTERGRGFNDVAHAIEKWGQQLTTVEGDKEHA